MSIRRSILLFTFVAASILTTRPSAAQQVIDTVGTGTNPLALAVNPATNRIYVANVYSGTVTVIDGANNTVVTTVQVGRQPLAIAANPLTNRIYTVNHLDHNVTVINGATNTASNVPVGQYPYGIAIDTAANRIYVTSDVVAGTVTRINGADNSTSSVAVGQHPQILGINPVTKRIYVTNYASNSVSVLDATSFHNIATIPVGLAPNNIAVSSLTNRIYVSNRGGLSVSVIDGASNGVIATLPLGAVPQAMALNPVTNILYVATGNNKVTLISGTQNLGSVSINATPNAIVVNPVTNKIYVTDGYNELTMINGDSNSTATLTVGGSPWSIAANLAINRVYVGNYSDNTVSVVAGANAAPLEFVALTPCRLVDTRKPGGGGAIPGGTSRSFRISQLGGCNVPSNAAAFSLNVTVVVPQHGWLGYLTIWPTGEDKPLVSTMNSMDGRTKANAAIVPAGFLGEVSVYATDTIHLVLDINGYFIPPGVQQTYQFYSLPPCRVADTRSDDFPQGLGRPYLSSRIPRELPVLQSPCIPAGVNAAAYSFNFTAVPLVTGQPLGYLSVWAAGEEMPVVSTLNNPTGTIVANAAIVPAGSSGAISVMADLDTDLAVDINGYFAAPGQNGLAMYPAAPCRVIDTRRIGNGQPFSGELPVNVASSVCAPPGNTRAYVFNATVVPSALGYLTLWPHDEERPEVSTLNALDGWIASNMAIVPTTNGAIDAYASGVTHLILDISGYFAPR